MDRNVAFYWIEVHQRLAATQCVNFTCDSMNMKLTNLVTSIQKPVEFCQEGFHQANEAYFKFVSKDWVKEFLTKGALELHSRQTKCRNKNNILHHKKK